MKLISEYHKAVEAIVRHAPAADKFVHVQAGLIVWLAAALLLRRPLRSPIPLAIVCVAEAANETMDRLNLGNWNWPDTRGDILATLFWPVVLTVALQWCGWLRQ